jgi:REP element-mobilizing transposase RayT
MNLPSTISQGPIQKRQGAYLPHWTADQATYFVTFRLGDSLPQHIVDAYKRERDALLAALHRQRGTGVPPVVAGKQTTPNLDNTASEHQANPPSKVTTADEAQRIQRLFSAKIERYLDSGVGACWMNKPEIADLVQNALLFFHTQRYDLHAWSVMPNHVHAVLQPKAPFDFSAILHSWKSFTSKAANKILSRQGSFWQPEPYDHLVRNQEELQRCINYTLNNPARAGLKDWPWVGTHIDRGTGVPPVIATRQNSPNSDNHPKPQ